MGLHGGAVSRWTDVALCAAIAGKSRRFPWWGIRRLHGSCLATSLVCANSVLSRRHARLDPVGLTLTDLGSANGTFVGGARLAPQVSAPLAIGAMFTLANEGFHIEAE